MLLRTLHKLTAVLAAAGAAQAYKLLAPEELQHLLSDKYSSAARQNFDPKNTTGLLAPILRVRLPGTKESAEVRAHFRDFFTQSPVLAHGPAGSSGWQVEEDSFYDITPVPPVPGGDVNVSFTNLAAVRDPPGTRPGDVGRLTLVAHYDSKREPEGFIGATDSAFPCALILQVLANLDAALSRKWQAGSNGGKHMRGLQVLLLDGEEALKDWSATDSIYGARHMARTWDKQTGDYGVTTQRKSRLDAIDLFLLLDLLGTPAPNIPSYYKHTDWAHVHLGRLQRLIRGENTEAKKKDARDNEKKDSSGKQKGVNKAEEGWFASPDKFFMGGRIGDDHLPFYNFGVPILHLIPMPFPHVWHTIDDDSDHLDMATMVEWAQIMTIFVAEYMELSGYLI
jgi:hypothetical protein